MVGTDARQIVFSGDPLLEELVEAFAGMRGLPVSCSSTVGISVVRFRMIVADGDQAEIVAKDLFAHLACHAPELTAIVPTRYRLLPVRRDWARSHRRHLRGRAVAECFFIHPPWEQPEVPDGLIRLSIDPGASFGTGHHPTTALCLAWLAQSAVSGKTVLDAGCGSGVLAIAAAALGAAAAVGFDIDAEAVATADENAARNGHASCCRFLCGPVGLLAEDRFDLVLANMLPSEFLPIAAALIACLAPGGTILFSGIDAERLPDVRAALARFPVSPGEALLAEGWAALPVSLGAQGIAGQQPAGC